jgi:hypothetical protein
VIACWRDGYNAPNEQIDGCPDEGFLDRLRDIAAELEAKPLRLRTIAAALGVTADWLLA